MEEKDSCVVDPQKYVVLDVETNGLSAIKHDLLSISIFKPDTGEEYNRFLPLELNDDVYTTEINGITIEDLTDTPLSQQEVNELIHRFDLKNRTILTYVSIDEKFMIKYFLRHKLQGIEYFAFYNFKHEIISSSFSEGNITKDNLCNLFGIENVQDVHTGRNDCLLEWELYKSMNGHRLLITDNKVFEFSEDYIVPASFISTYPNLKYYLPGLPKITCTSRVVFSLPVSTEKIMKFPTNFNGMILEHLINSMLQVHPIDSKIELIENKKKLKYLGKLPSYYDIVPMEFNEDGSMTAIRPQDKKMEEDINTAVKELKNAFVPMVEFIREKIFDGSMISSQELVIHPDYRILALCDLSNEDAVLEIKANSTFLSQKYVDQLYYESKGRRCYILITNWDFASRNIIYCIHEVFFDVEEYVDRKQARYNDAKNIIETDDIELIYFVDTRSPVKLRCRNCGNEWTTSFNLARKQRPCPQCSPKVRKIARRSKSELSEDEEIAERARKQAFKFQQFKSKIEGRSENTVTAISYAGSNCPATVKCLICGYEWEARADHILNRPFCPSCRRMKRRLDKMS
jgi:DNA polymerase III epsilon subunit-like protein/Zn finger protein HypA/HybF involved in hydrogenase expression